MASVANPVVAWVATLHAGTAVAAGSSVTVTLHITQGWEIHVPFLGRANTASADSAVTVFPSSDGGATYVSVPMTGFALPNQGNHNVDQSGVIRIPTGQYAIRMLASSPTVTFQVLTQAVITAVNIV